MGKNPGESLFRRIAIGWSPRRRISLPKVGGLRTEDAKRTGTKRSAWPGTTGKQNDLTVLDEMGYKDPVESFTAYSGEICHLILTKCHPDQPQIGYHEVDPGEEERRRFRRLTVQIHDRTDVSSFS